jgi:hypothetical protein
MVPIASNTPNLMLHDVHRALAEQRNFVDATSVEGAFVSWINDNTDTPFLASLPKDLAVTNYHHVAVLSFLMEIDPVRYKNDNSLLEDGLTRVAGRAITLFETEPAPFRHDAIALLGLALGAKRIGGEVQAKVLKWMQTFVNPSDKAVPSWRRVFYFATLHTVGGEVNSRDLQDLSECSDLQLALTAKGCNAFESVDFNLAYYESCQKAMSKNFEPTIAACGLTVLHYLSKSSQTISINKPTIQQILSLLNRLPSGLKRWPWEDKPLTKSSTLQRWDIQNEYHVQSLVYSLLAPIFPDIEDEFYLEPVAQLNPRADIGLPSLSLIIEIKFLRSGVPFRKIIEEVAADASLYFKKDSVFAKKYSQMIVLLWDDSARTQNHHEFTTGASKLPNISGAVVVSRPGSMVSQTISETEKSKPVRKKRG